MDRCGRFAADDSIVRQAARVAPGSRRRACWRACAAPVELEIPVLEAFTFRPGQLQATAVFALADFAAVAAAGSLLGSARNIDNTPRPP